MLNLEEQIDVRCFFWFFMTCISLIGMAGRREGFVDEGVGCICSIAFLESKSKETEAMGISCHP